MVGCTNMEPSMAPADKVTVTDPNLVGIDEALNNADDHFDLVFGKGTRAGRKVSNVETYRPGILTRSSETEGEVYGFYIVNYENDGGFVMISADRRRESMYAISDEGSLNLIDTLENGGLSWYVNQYLAEVCTPGYDGIIPPIGQIQPKDSISPIAPPSVVRKNLIREPMLTGFMTKFHQGDPYNKYCFTDSYAQALVGCGPLSVGTVIAFYETPESIDDCTFNWNVMKSSSTHDSWSKLFRKLGDSKYLNATYGVSGTSIVPNRVPVTFNSLGYNGIKISDFDTAKVIEMLRKGKLAICGGYTNNEEGHEWIIDGAYELYKESPSVTPGEGPLITTENYYHCVWGNSGKANGYFRYGNVMGGTPYERDSNSSGSQDYYKNMYLIYGF